MGFSLGDIGKFIANPLGGQLGLLGSNSGQRNATTTTAPPAFLQPSLSALANRALEFSQTPQQFFPGSTVVPFSPETQQALDLQSQRALAGSPVTDAAQNQIQSTLQGDFLNGPIFQQQLQAATDQILPQVGSFFGAGGRFGSGLAQEAAANGIGRAFTGLLNNERGRQIQAATLAPQLAQQDFANIGALADVGQTKESQNQQLLQEQINRFNFGQLEPFQRLQQLASLINPVAGTGGVTTVQPARAGLGQRLLGGGLAGASIGNSVAPGGLGAIGGGLLGAFLGAQG